MSIFYYTVRADIEKYPSNIDNALWLQLADNLCQLLGCRYDKLGYSLLHPDYEYKDIGKMFSNTEQGRKKFLQSEIPMECRSNEGENPSKPYICFTVKEKRDKLQILLPILDIRIIYPHFDTRSLRIEVHIRKDLVTKKFTLVTFDQILQAIARAGCYINAAFVHYYTGNSRRDLFANGVGGIVTINDWRIISHCKQYTTDWKGKMMDVFYMNSIKRESISDTTVQKIKKIVGSKNVMEENGQFIFKLPQLPGIYLINRILPTYSRLAVKWILQQDGLCKKDASILASILRL